MLHYFDRKKINIAKNEFLTQKKNQSIFCFKIELNTAFVAYWLVQKWTKETYRYLTNQFDKAKRFL